MPTQIATARNIATDYFPGSTPRAQYNAGYAACVNRKEYHLLTTDEERRGFEDAMKHRAYAETNQYLVSRGLVS